MEENSEWVYQRQLALNEADSSIWLTDTLRFKIDGDTLFENKVYKKMVSKKGFTKKIIRVDGSRYFERKHDRYPGTDDLYFEPFNGYLKENMFLDTDKAVGSSWVSFYDELQQREFIIKSKNAKQTILGKVYQDVIEIEVKYYYQELGADKYWLSTKHYYAKDVGEIYNLYPYPVSGYYSNSSFLLIK